MDKNKAKQIRKVRRHARVRAKISGTKNIPRLSVFRSNISLYAQLIDDENGKTLVSASSKEVKSKSDKTKVAEEVGKILSKKAKDNKITKVVFDKGSYKYHGRIKALAESARAGGLEF